jgi:hypothetical protein
MDLLMIFGIFRVFFIEVELMESIFRKFWSRLTFLKMLGFKMTENWWRKDILFMLDGIVKFLSSPKIWENLAYGFNFDGQ